jgi:hypothetical protein
VYVVLVDLEGDRAALKVFIHPLVSWIWIGGFVFVYGNALLLWRAGPGLNVPRRSRESRTIANLWSLIRSAPPEPHDVPGSDTTTYGGEGPVRTYHEGSRRSATESPARR